MGKGMLFLVEQAFVGRDEKRAPLKTPAWEATCEQLLNIIWKTVDVPGGIRPQIKYCLLLSWLMYMHSPFLIHTNPIKILRTNKLLIKNL